MWPHFRIVRLHRTKITAIEHDMGEGAQRGAGKSSSMLRKGRFCSAVFLKQKCSALSRVVYGLTYGQMCDLSAESF